MTAPGAPRFANGILDHPVTWLLARLALVGANLIGGVVKLTNWLPNRHFSAWHRPRCGRRRPSRSSGSLRPDRTRQLVWLDADMLGVFTLLAAITADAFWTMSEGAERFAAANAFFEHLDPLGGFLLAAMLAEWRKPRA